MNDGHDGTGLFLGLVALVGAIAAIALRQWARSPKRQIEGWLRQIEAGEKPDFQVRTDYDYGLVLTDVGFEIQPLKAQAEETVRVEWERVNEANAYKRDLWSTDQICIAFKMEDEIFIEIHEEMRGFGEICEKLPVVLSGALSPSQWMMEITVPAFEPCLTPLFARSEGHLSG
jgi:hypothetical protein